MATDESWELQFDSEEMRVRLHRQRFLERSGFSEFGAFRLAMRFDIDKEKAADMLAHGATEPQVIDLLID